MRQVEINYYENWTSVKVAEFWPGGDDILMKWIFNNCTGGFDPIVGYVRFENIKDAVIFKLKWGV